MAATEYFLEKRMYRSRVRRVTFVIALYWTVLWGGYLALELSGMPELTGDELLDHIARSQGYLGFWMLTGLLPLIVVWGLMFIFGGGKGNK